MRRILVIIGRAVAVLIVIYVTAYHLARLDAGYSCARIGAMPVVTWRLGKYCRLSDDNLASAWIFKKERQ